MKNSWRDYLRRLARVSLVFGSVAWSSAMCYAAQLAYDDADDPVYADGWQEGDDGGTNFTAWNFDGTYASTVQQRIDDGSGSGALGSSTFNDIDRAWSMFNPVVQTGQRDIARAGRGFAPLTVGQTLKVVVDNPSEEQFFRGYFVRLTGNTGGVNGNMCYSGTPCTPGAMPKPKMLFQMFEYFTYGEWGIAEADGPDPDSDGDFFFTGLFDTDTVNPPDPPQVGTDSGARFEVTLTGTNTYQAKMIPLDNVGATFTHNGVLDNPGSSIDWIEFLHFNTVSELGFDTDFFIRSIEISDATLPGDYNQNDTVDAADFTLWRDNLGSLTSLPNDDTAGVGPDDYIRWKTNFGDSLGSGSGAAAGLSSSANASVPEPAAVVLLAFAFFIAPGLVCRRSAFAKLPTATPKLLLSGWGAVTIRAVACRPQDADAPPPH